MQTLETLLPLAQQASERKQPTQAIQYYTQALDHAVTPQHKAAINLNIALIYGEEQQLESALHYFQQVIKYDTKNAVAHSGIGQILHRFGHLEQALQHYKIALTHDPSVHNFLVTAKTFHRLGRYQQALQCYQEAAKIEPKSAELNFSVALLLLLHGNYQEGWQRYEARWQLPNRGFRLPATDAPRWRGENLETKTLLIIHEQGFGDTIQFLRYIPLIKAKQIILKCHAGLKTLAQHSFATLPITLVNPDEPVAEPFDYFTPLVSFPLIFQTQVDSIPHNIPYLHTNSAKIQQWKTTLTVQKINIGIVWSGNPKHVNDANRSCPLDYFVKLAQQYPSIQCYSLQKGETAQQLTPDMPIQNYSHQLQDFDDTAAFISALDLIITVDTSVAHLAGALGQKVWIILPFVPDWRWLLNRQDSPWYPTATLFRQTTIKDWDAVFTQIQHELTQLRS